MCWVYYAQALNCQSQILMEKNTMTQNKELQCLYKLIRIALKAAGYKDLQNNDLDVSTLAGQINNLAASYQQQKTLAQNRLNYINNVKGNTHANIKTPQCICPSSAPEHYIFCPLWEDKR